MNYTRALKEEQFHIYFQPRIDSHTQQLVGAEALTRLIVDGVIYSPVSFLPTIEDEGLSDDFGAYVITHALAHFKAWHKQVPDLRLSVNIAVSQLATRLPSGQLALKQVIKDALQTYQLPASCLELEITESTPIDDADLILALKELKTIGVAIVLDDMGKGFNTLHRLYTLVNARVLDGFKIDKQFVTNAYQCEFKQAFLSTLIHLGKRLHLTVTAEGIETQADINWITKTACHQLQGYGYHPPLPSHEFQSVYFL